MKTREDKIYSFFGHLIMTILTLLAIIPILLMFISSLTDNATLLQNGYSFLPEKWSTYAYEWVFTSSSSMVIKAYGMSFILTATGVVCSLALTTCLAYGLSKKRSAGTQCPDLSGVLYHAVQRSLVPTYINYTTVFHVKDTFFGLLVPSLMMSAFNVLLMKSYFVTGVRMKFLRLPILTVQTNSRLCGRSPFRCPNRLLPPLPCSPVSLTGMTGTMVISI